MDDTLIRMLQLGQKGYTYSQIIILLGLEQRGETNPGLVRAMEGLAYGCGSGRGSCGALTGGACLLAFYAGKGSDEETASDRLPVRPPGIFAETENGCPFDCGLCPAHRQRSCTVIIEVTQRCDLACPVCYAAAPSPMPDPSLDAIAQLFGRAREAGTQSNIQLSGGEPTMRDDLPEIVALGRRMGFSFIQVNTNGLRLGRDRDYVRALKQAGLASVFLQFDGTTDGIYRELRARPLVEAKEAAVATCGEHGIGVVLVPTLVPGANTQNIGAILRAGLAWAPTVRGVQASRSVISDATLATPKPANASPCRR